MRMSLIPTQETRRLLVVDLLLFLFLFLSQRLPQRLSLPRWRRRLTASVRLCGPW